LRVYDQRGRFVRKLAAGGRLSLLRSLVWDGRDHAGAKVTAGTYYVVLGSGDAWLAQAVVMAP
jgi:flagellar hook assembly protein FlgD